MLAGAIPLPDKPFLVGFKRHSKRLKQSSDSALKRFAEYDHECELGPVLQVDFSDERHIAVGRPVEFPIHLQVVGKIGPAVALSDVAAREPREWNIRGKIEPSAVPFGCQHLTTGSFHHVAVIS